MRQLVLEPAFILHTRPYRDTSLLVELFTEQHGRLTCIAKGARGKRHAWRHILMPFQPLIAAFAGKGEILTLTHAESTGMPLNLQGKSLFCGFYLNELLLYLLAKQDASPQIFQLYVDTLIQLKNIEIIEVSLRYFERYLLSSLGYEIDFNFDFNGKPIEHDKQYLFRFDQGFIAVTQQEVTTTALYQGEHLLAIAKDSYNDIVVLKQAKNIFSAKIQFLLGHKTLKSREIFQACLTT